jgi:hypothetical protein
MNYTAPVDVFVGQITEVDMVSAGMTVIRSEGLLPRAVLAEVEALPKHQQSVAIGKLSRTPELKALSGKITDGIRRRVENMLQINSIGDDRILSVKRDAVFVTGPPPARLVLSDGTKFKLKNGYTAFAKLGTVEVYGVPRRGTVDLKGVPEEKRHLHRQFVTRMVLDVLGLIERADRVEAAATLQQFLSEYSALRLPAGFYREFNSASAFARHAGRSLYLIDSDGTDIDKSEIDITHNIRNVVIPLARSIA